MGGEKGEEREKRRKKGTFLMFPPLCQNWKNKCQKPCLVFCVSANYIPTAGRFWALHPSHHGGRPPAPQWAEPPLPSPGMPPRGSALLFWQSLSLLPGRAPSHFCNGCISTLCPIFHPGFTASHVLIPFLIFSNLSFSVRLTETSETLDPKNITKHRHGIFTSQNLTENEQKISRMRFSSM